MNYTLDRFASKDKPILEAITDTMKTVVMASSMSRLMDKDLERRQNNVEAKRAMVKTLALATRAGGGEDEEEQVDLMGSILKRVLKFIGKKLVKHIVKPILRFAGRIAMTLIRFVARTMVRFIIVPAIELVSAFVIANPITAGILAVGALAAGGYYLWKKFFGEPAVKPTVVVEPAQAPPVEVAPGTIDEDLGGPAVLDGVTETPTVAAPESTVFERVTEVVSKPIEAVKQFVAPKGKKGKFTGFGSDVDGYIKEASSRFPILPEDVLRGFIKMEAGWTGAMSPTGAIGTGQFTAGTWNGLIPKGGAAIGMTPLTGVYNENPPRIRANPNGNFRTEQDPRFNRRVNTLATALLASQNAEMLRAKGLPITGENLYMMHNIGPGIIPVMLGQAATPATLKAMQQNGMLPNMSASQFLEFQKGRFNVSYQDANTTTNLVSDQPQMADAAVVQPAPTKAKSKAAPKAPVVASNDGTKQGDLIRGPGKTIVSA